MSPVIPSEARNLKSVNGVCASSLDSSLRCAAFRMTGEEGAAFRMTEQTYFSGLNRFVYQMSSEPRPIAFYTDTPLNLSLYYIESGIGAEDFGDDY